MTPAKPLAPFTLHVVIGDNGPAYERQFQPSATWGELVAFATASTGIAADRLDLYKDSERVHAYADDEVLRTMKLVDGDRLVAVDYRVAWTGDVTIKTLTGKAILLKDVSNEGSVKGLKQRVSDSEGIPTEQQRLVFVGKQLDDDAKTLMDYRVRPGATIHLILRLRASE